MRSYIQELTFLKFIHTTRNPCASMRESERFLKYAEVCSAIVLSLSNWDTGGVTGIQFPSGAGRHFFSIALKTSFGCIMSPV